MTETTYNKEAITEKLASYKTLLTASEIMQVAIAEEISTETIKNYMKGQIKTLALGQALVNRFDAILAAK